MIKKEIEYRIPDKDGKPLRLGRKVTTPHGQGKIVGQDVPAGGNPRPRRSIRYAVKVTEPLKEFKDMVRRFKDDTLCYWHDEIGGVPYARTKPQ